MDMTLMVIQPLACENAIPFDPLLTMRSTRQLVAIHGNGSRLFSRLPLESHLRLIATGWDHGAP